MSAIFGAINLKNQTISNDTLFEWREYISSFKIDRIDDIAEDTYFMACGHQYFTREAENELLPVKSQDENIIFTADCVIDNRNELIQELNLANDTPDGSIIFSAYQQWGIECLKHLKGAFSFAVYDRKKKKLYLATDQFSQRILFYYVNEGKVFFSTTIKPIISACRDKLHQNERWLLDCVSMASPAMITEPKETAFLEINKLVCGTYVEISLDENDQCKVREVRYYDPLNTYKIDKSITLKQSEEMCRQVMSESVRNIISRGVKVGTELSAGLDSSTVACLAAIILNENGDVLNSYTSIPMKESGLTEAGSEIFDESQGVMEIVKLHPNIIPKFIDTHDRNCLREAREIVRDWEMPCKSQQNAVWGDEIYRQAALDGCRIVLSGAIGNTSISAGEMGSLFFENLKHFRLGKAKKSLDLARKSGISRKRILKYYLKEMQKFYKFYFSSDERDCYKYVLTRPEFGEKYQLSKRFNKQLYHHPPYISLARLKKESYLMVSYAQIGEADTKKSLKYGVLTRDPMRNVDVNRMCMMLPLECFVSYDYDRRLIRAGMEGIIPDKIRLELVKRGRQSGDNMYRIKAVWQEILPDMKAALYRDATLKYLSKDLLDEYFASVNLDNFDKQFDKIYVLVDSYFFACFLEYIENNVKK